MKLEWLEKWIDIKNQRLRVQNKKGTLPFFNVMLGYYLFKKNMRDGEGVEQWPYGVPLCWQEQERLYGF